jgi:hypothetical protein
MTDGASYALNRPSWKENPALKAASEFLAAIGQEGQGLERTFNVWTDGGKEFRDEYLQRLQRQKLAQARALGNGQERAMSRRKQYPDTATTDSGDCIIGIQASTSRAFWVGCMAVYSGLILLFAMLEGAIAGAWLVTLLGLLPLLLFVLFVEMTHVAGN